MFKPMLAAEGVLGCITYPKLASAKLNGVRAVNPTGTLFSRTLKQIPNIHTRQKYSHPRFVGMDGELIVGHFGDPEVFTHSTSGVMAVKGIPDVKWYVFDQVMSHIGFSDRVADLEKRVAALDPADGVVWVPQMVVKSDEEVQKFHDECVALGYEGIVLRSPRGAYKFGRSTAREEGFMRFVDWHRSECRVLGVNEGLTNTNAAFTNEMGRTARSTNQENLIPTGSAGSMDVVDIHSGIHFSIALGTKAQCDAIWANKLSEIGMIYTYKFRQPVNIGGKPRFPILEGRRHPDDMS